MSEQQIDYRECTTCGPPGHVGLTFVAEVKGFDPSFCRRCEKNTLLLKEPPQTVLDDLRARERRPDWFAKHCEVVSELPLPAFAKIISSPEAVQKIYMAFPPACVVRIRSTGAYGINRALVAGDSEFPTIRVIDKPGDTEGAEHSLDDLEVVGHWNGLTPAAISSILDMKTPATIESKGPKIGRNEACPCGKREERGAILAPVKYKHCCGRLDGSRQNGGLQ